MRLFLTPIQKKLDKDTFFSYIKKSVEKNKTLFLQECLVNFLDFPLNLSKAREDPQYLDSWMADAYDKFMKKMKKYVTPAISRGKYSHKTNYKSFIIQKVKEHRKISRIQMLHLLLNDSPFEGIYIIRAFYRILTQIRNHEIPNIKLEGDYILWE